MSEGVHFFVSLTNEEAQYIVNMATAFYNVANREKWKINPVQTVAVIKLLEKLRRAIDGEVEILEAIDA